MFNFNDYHEYFQLALQIIIVYGVMHIVLDFMLSPLHFLKIIRQNTGHSYSSIFKSYTGSKGSLILFRGTVLYILINVFRCFAFYFEELFPVGKIPHSAIDFTLASNLILGMLYGGFIETIVTFKIEVRDIMRCANIQYKSLGFLKNWKLFIYFVIRNSFTWLALIILYNFKIQYNINIYNALLITIPICLLCSLLLTPFDLIITRLCSNVHNNHRIEMSDLIKKQGFKHLFTGFIVNFIHLYFIDNLVDLVFTFGF